MCLSFVSCVLLFMLSVFYFLLGCDVMILKLVLIVSLMMLVR